MKGDPAAHAEGERTRAAIVAQIASGVSLQKEIAARVGVTQSVVSSHIRRLIAAGRVREVTPRRGRIPPTYALVFVEL